MEAAALSNIQLSTTLNSSALWAKLRAVSSDIAKLSTRLQALGTSIESCGTAAGSAICAEVKDARQKYDDAISAIRNAATDLYWSGVVSIMSATGDFQVGHLLSRITRDLLTLSFCLTISLPLSPILLAPPHLSVSLSPLCVPSLSFPHSLSLPLSLHSLSVLSSLSLFSLPLLSILLSLFSLCVLSPPFLCSLSLSSLTHTQTYTHTNPLFYDGLHDPHAGTLRRLFFT